MKDTTVTDTPIAGSSEELPPRLLNIKGLATLLGVDPRHVQRLVTEKRIPYIKWGHDIRFDPAEIRRWLNEYRGGAERRRWTVPR